MTRKRNLSMLAILLTGTILITGCTGTGGEVPQAETGNMVKVHYTGKLDDGTTFDSSIDGEPLQFTLGEGQMISGFEKAVLGMKLGEKKTVKIPADEAYPRREELVGVVGRDQLPADLDPVVGQVLQLQLNDGRVTTAVVIEISESTVTLDANHPLAGKDLTFEIELVEIN